MAIFGRSDSLNPSPCVSSDRPPSASSPEPLGRGVPLGQHGGDIRLLRGAHQDGPQGEIDGDSRSDMRLRVHLFADR